MKGTETRYAGTNHTAQCGPVACPDIQCGSVPRLDEPYSGRQSQDQAKHAPRKPERAVLLASALSASAIAEKSNMTGNDR